MLKGMASVQAQVSGRQSTTVEQCSLSKGGGRRTDVDRGHASESPKLGELTAHNVHPVPCSGEREESRAAKGGDPES